MYNINLYYTNHLWHGIWKVLIVNNYALQYKKGVVNL